MQIRKGSFDNPKDPRDFKWYDFETDPVIDVVLVYVTRAQPCGREILFLKRSHRVGALAGQWSVIAGVDDYVDNDPEDASLNVVYKELNEEIGMGNISDATGRIVRFGSNE